MDRPLADITFSTLFRTRHSSCLAIGRGIEVVHVVGVVLKLRDTR